MTTTLDVRATGRRVEQLLDSLTSAADPQLRMHAEELVRLLVELYGTGLARLVSIVLDELAEPEAGTETETGRREAAVRAGLVGRFAELLVADELLSGLLVLHGLHPQDVTERVQLTLDAVLPTLGDHADGVELLGVTDEGVVRLRLRPKATGQCGGGCGSTGASVRSAIERAIADAVPDATGVEVEELPRQQAAPALIPVESLFRDRRSQVDR